MPDFTKKAIIASFVKLLEQKPLNKITVKDIVLDCGINRNSFYYHFSDLPSLIEELLKSEADRIIEEHASVDSIEECISTALSFALKNKTAVLHLYNSTSREEYERYLNHIAYYSVKEYFNGVSSKLTIAPNEQDTHIILRVCSFELVGFILDWMNKGMEYDIMDETRRFCYLFSDTLENAILKSAEKSK